MFLLIDGDRVGDHFDLLASGNLVDEYRRLSTLVDEEREDVCCLVSRHPEAVIILSAADTILAEVPAEFECPIGGFTTDRFSWSAGLGPDLRTAQAALAAAKALGRGQVVAITSAG